MSRMWVGLAVLAALLVVPADPADAVYEKYAIDGLHDVGLTGFADLVVDEAQTRVFVSSGQAVVVTDLDGTPLGAVDVAAGVLGASDDGSAIFALDHISGALSRIDASSLSITSSDSVSGVCPRDLAFTAATLWVLGGCSGDPTSIYALNPQTLDVVGQNAVDSSIAAIAAAPAVPDAVFAWGADTVHHFDAQGGGASSLTESASHVYSSRVTAVSIEPGSGAILSAHGTGISVSDPATLADSTWYAADGNPDGLAPGSDGTVAFATRGAQSVSYYLPGVDSVEGRDLPGPRWNVVTRGMQFASGHLFSGAARTDRSGSTVYRLWIVTPARRSEVTVSTTSQPYSFDFGGTVTVRGQLGSPTAYNGQTLEIYARPIGREKRLIGSGPVDDNGVFTSTFKARRNTTIIVVFPGDDTYAPSSAAMNVRSKAKMVIRMIRTKVYDGDYALYKYWRYAIARVHVSPHHAGQCLAFGWVYRKGKIRYSSMKNCVTINKHGNAYLAFRGGKKVVGGRVRVSASFKGDKVNAFSSSGPAYFRFVS